MFVNVQFISTKTHTGLQVTVTLSSTIFCVCQFHATVGFSAVLHTLLWHATAIAISKGDDFSS